MQARLQIGGKGSRDQRTKNIFLMSLTLAVLKVISLLNDDANWRVARSAYTVCGVVRGELRAGRREAAGNCCAECTCMREGGGCRDCGGRPPGGKPAWNMPCMLVTLEVSKLSFWLNAFAFCAEGRKARHPMRGGLRAGSKQGGRRRATVMVHSACRGECATADWEGAEGGGA